MVELWDVITSVMESNWKFELYVERNELPLKLQGGVINVFCY